MWLQKLVAIHLRMATWQDHLFLLFHILRCPGGIASWATAMIQVPFDQSKLTSTGVIFSSDEVHHCVAILKILLLPISARREFLIKLHDDETRPIDPLKEDIWILVDSDGEEDKDIDGTQGLKENDLIALLNQVPIKQLFR